MPRPLMADERELIERMRGGDAAAFESIFRAYYARLVRFARSISALPAAEAEEVVQDVFVAIWASRATWVVQHGLDAYLYGATRNGVLHAERHAAVERRHAARVAQDGADASIPARAAPPADAYARMVELDAAIRDAMAALPPRCREAFLLHRRHDLSYGEIAAVMHTSPRTVKVQIAKALTQLRLRLASWR